MPSFLFKDWPADALPISATHNGENGHMPTVAEVVSLYLEHLQFRLAAGDYSKQGLSDIRRELVRFCRTFGNQPVEQCKRNDLSRYLEQNPQLQAADTIKRVVGSICRAFSWAADEELIARSPYRMPQSIKRRCRGRNRRRPATIPEYVTIIKRGSRGLRLLCFLLYHTGARPCEIRGLRVDQVDLDRAEIRLETDEHKTGRQTGEQRVIGLDNASLRILRNVIRHLPPDQSFLIVGPRGRPWIRREAAESHFRFICNQHGLPKDFVLYSFRHLYKTDCDELGISPQQAADQLGHKLPGIGHVYSHAKDRKGYLPGVAQEVTRRRREARRMIHG